MPQWAEELRTKFSIPSEQCAGRKLITFRPSWDVGAIITTYTSARLYLEEIPQGRFEMLVLDEAHKLRNLYGAETIPQVAQRFRKALADRLFRYVLMLTATPIQNRLWDLYSLVDLLTVARGHENPFGSPGMFKRRFIEDDATTARRLRHEARDEFRSIVYGYMSRVRRGDANLQFPERIVQMHTVPPTQDELALIRALAEPILKVRDRRAQISILQALCSSPQALKSQLLRMGAKGTFPAADAAVIAGIVDRMGMSAKLHGVAALADQLRSDHPERWRMVIFTGRLETQTTIESFLSSRGISVKTINGNSGERNQETIRSFWANPPGCHVIVSTEAGSEGVNLQAANVLVNYDLPWNPMIVEQRIGRIQRLASNHANVCIYNITLAGTFEQVIVGRLMEKLQMAAHAIGDVEALLEASGMDDGDQSSFEEQIRSLVVKSLSGMDVTAAAEKAARSILEAKAKLEREEKTINEMLGSMNGATYQGPQTPSLPATERSMTVEELTLQILEKAGGKPTLRSPGVYRIERGNTYEMIRFAHDGEAPPTAILYAPGSPSFERLVRSVAEKAMHRVEDRDANPAAATGQITERWIKSFGGIPVAVQITNVDRHFEGKALVRVRATVAHDSYERLVEVPCNTVVSYSSQEKGMAVVPATLSDIAVLGVNGNDVVAYAMDDEGIAEFCRFYAERKTFEVAAAGNDERKRKKLDDEFTPRLEMELVGFAGGLHREIQVRSHYRLSAGGREYTSALTAMPLTGRAGRVPEMKACIETGKSVPVDCLDACAVSGRMVIKDLLVKSEASGRLALLAHTLTCSLSGKRILSDEAEPSDLTGQLVTQTLLKTSALSSKKGEPGYFGICEFSGDEVLNTELALSEVSAKRYRLDQKATSAISSATGHRKEFLTCAETGQLVAQKEAERCEASSKMYAPGLLKRCAATGTAVHPSELELCAVTNHLILQSLLKTSALSGRRAQETLFARCDFTDADVLEEELATSELSGQRYRADEQAASSVSGKKGHRSEFLLCTETRQSLAPAEAEQCGVSGRYFRPGILERCAVSQMLVHPSELERCAVTGKKALNRSLVTSSLSGARLLEKEATASITGTFCAPLETKTCGWSGANYHPDDLRVCDLSGILHHARFAEGPRPERLRPLLALLDGISRKADASNMWESVATKARPMVGRCQVEAAELSPDGKQLAVTLGVKKLLGFRVLQAGLLYSITDDNIVGRVAIGQRNGRSWVEAKV